MINMTERRGWFYQPTINPSDRVGSKGGRKEGEKEKQEIIYIYFIISSEVASLIKWIFFSARRG